MASKLPVLQSKAIQVASMAAKLPVFQPKAISEASKSAAKHAREYYSKLLEQNKQYIQDPPTVERCNELSNQLFYTRLASIPNRYGAFLKELNDLKIYIKSKPRITLDNAGVAALLEWSALPGSLVLK